MSERLVKDIEWKFLENSKVLISSNDLEGQTFAIDARAWCNDCNSFPQNISSAKFNASSLKNIFQQLHGLSIAQIRVIVVFHKSFIQNENKDFFERCVELLQAMSIPYVEADSIEDIFIQLVKEKVVEGCLTEDPTVFFHGLMFAFQYSHFQSEICSNKRTFYLAKYSTMKERTSDHLQCLHHLATFVLKNQQYYDNDNNERDVNSLKEDLCAHKIRPSMARACKKHTAVMRPPSKMKIKATPLINKNADEENKSIGKVKMVLEKLLNVVLDWSENPLNRLKEFQRKVAEKETESFSEVETDFLQLYKNLHGKTLFEMEEAILEEIQPIKSDSSHGLKTIKWKRPEFKVLHKFLQTNHISCPLKQILGYLVAYDFFELLKSHVSGDSYPEGISRPERILKVLKKNEVEMYSVKWLYIPGADSVKPKDLITTELKNTFCAVFPKVASKFEGWSVKSGSDGEDGTDGEENYYDDYRPIATPGSPKKCLKNRKRTGRDPIDTPASAGSSGTRSTMNQYFVAKKKLIFDPIK